ncbi:MAG: AAA family ATPase [Bdellovibrionota bacterium]
MYSRFVSYQNYSSFFIFGARGVGKSMWVKAEFPNAIYVDLLSAKIFNELQANPSRLVQMITGKNPELVIIDEIQKIPALLDEVHKLIEEKKIKFILTGSSARKLKQQGVNLLAGRALTKKMYPLTARELGSDFKLEKSLQYGQLPKAYLDPAPDEFLHAYIKTYLKEEVMQEGLTRNIEAFARFLEAASFSQGQYLNICAVASDCHVERKTVEQYFQILEDMLLAYRLPVFTKKAKREITRHPKFFFFDVGVFRALRPRGPLDRPEEIDGPALEGLLLQELIAENEYLNRKYNFFCWKAQKSLDVDIVMYGPAGLIAIEIKRTARLRGGELDGLKLFKKDYPMAKTYFIWGSDEERNIDGVNIIAMQKFLTQIEKYI